MSDNSSPDLYEQILQIAIQHLKASCSGTPFTDCQVRDFLTRQPQEDGTFYTQAEYDLMYSDEHDEFSDAAPLWQLDSPTIKSKMTLEDLSLSCDADTLEHVQDLLDRLFSVNFINCDFHINSLKLKRCIVRFEDCHFHQSWHVGTGALESYHGEMFERCDFKEPVYLTAGLEVWHEDELVLFRNCQMLELVIDQIKLQVQLFDNTDDYIQVLPQLTIKDSTLKRPLSLEKAQIERLCLEDSKLLKPISLAGSRIHEATFTDTKFRGVIDMQHSQINRLVMTRCDCREVVDMTSSVLGEKDGGNNKPQSASICFPFTTFHQEVSFRNTHWHGPLDLQHTTRKKSFDFKGFQLEKAARQYTDRETFRIIRHAFDSVGNHVDTGRCYAWEMDAYRHEMRGQGQLAERFLLWCNSWMSYHGQSYLRPLAWILLGMLFFTLLRHAYQENWLYRIYPPANDIISTITAGLNDLAQSLIIFKPLMVNGMEMLSLLFGLIFSTLTWQAVVAMRRHTRK